MVAVCFPMGQIYMMCRIVTNILSPFWSGMMTLIALLFGMLFLPAFTYAQTAPQPISIDEAVEMALANNLSLQRDALSLETTQQNFEAAFRVFYPRININGALNILNEQPGALFGIEQPQNIFAADISAQLSFTFRLFFEINLASLQYQSGQISFQQAQRNIALSVQSMYFTILLLAESINISEASLALAERRADQTFVRYNAGLVDEFTLLSARVAAANAVTPLEELRSQRKSAVRQLNLAIGNDIDAAIALVGDITPDIFAVDAERMRAELLPMSPNIQSLQKAIEIYETSKSIAITSFLPNVLLSYNFSQTFGRDIFTEADQFGDANSWTTGGGFSVTLSIPIDTLLPFSNTWITLAAAERDLQSAQIMLADAQQNLAIELYDRVEQLNQIAFILQTQQLNIARAERAYELADEGYRVGLREILEIRDAQNQLDSARFDYLSERFNYLTTQLQLINLLGIDSELLKRYRVSGI